MPGLTDELERKTSNISNGSKQPDNRKSKSDDSASFLRAARGGNTEKVSEYLKNGTDINTCNANGLNALHLSSKEGHVHIVQDLLARGAKIDASTKKGNTALHIASLAGQEEVVKILVAHSASVNVQSQNGFTPLYMAAQENHDGVVRFLLASGASQSLATEDGFTPLAVALQQGHDKVVAVLLENDTRGKVRLPALHIAAKKDDTKAAALLLQNDHNPDVTSKSGFTPLHIASHYGNENIAAVLLQRGADVNYSAKHNITPLHVAAKWGKSNMVSLLLDKGANLESRTRDGLTPLHCAARSGHENVVDMMVQQGAPISAKTKNGLAPLHMSSQGDHVDAARILLHHKAPVDEVTVDYLTALHVAAHCGHVRVAKLLLDRKADPNSRALNGFTPLHIACKKNRIKVVELLLKYGASIEATTESGLTPLHVASFMGCMNIVIYLIQHQASPDEATVRGETPLHLAARANQTDIIRILLRNGAKVDATAREQQTPLHIASRLGNVDIVVLLLQSGAKVDAVTKDLYTALHIAAKEGQEEVASILLEHGASMSSTTKKGFTPLHLAAKYGNIKVAKLLLGKETEVDAEGKNGVTPLHVAVHYDNTALALLLLERGASPHAAAKNGYTPLHISAKKNQLDIARTLLEYGGKVNSESKAGFTPLHLAAQEGHIEMAELLVKAEAEVNNKAKNGLTPLHLCAQEDRIEVAMLLVDSGAECDNETRAGYTPLHVAAHFGQINMVRYLLSQGVRVDVQNELGYTPLHQAAQQGHSQIVNLLLESNASPNQISNNGQTALSIAQKLGYISVVETLKVVTDEVVTTTTTTTVEEKYRVLAPESMQETFMSDSEDEGGEENPQDHTYKYLTSEEMKGLGDDSMQIDVTNDEKEKKESMNRVAELSIEKKILELEKSRDYNLEAEILINNDQTDNIEIPTKPPVSAGFLVSFMVDARGGAMRGCRHSGVRVIIPPRKAPMPMRVTCRYLKKDKLVHPPPLNEGEALASRILELGPAKANFLGPVIIEVPHFASLRGREREIIILRSDDGEKWREHSLEATEEAVQEVLQESFDGEDAGPLEDLNTNRITRILTTDFPQYFAIITRIRQELHYIGPEGGLVNSSVVPQVQALFPQAALTKKIKVGLQAQPIPPELTAKLLGNRVAVSPIVTVEPRRRKFHKPITLTIPVPVAAGKGMINQYSGDTPTLRLLCSITGGTTRAQWEDVTGSTPLNFLNDCVSFTTTVSARFWLMDCRNVPEATKMATTLYKEAIHVPFMAKYVVFAKRHEQLEARMRVFCMTDDREEKTLEHQEHFHEVAKSRDVEVLEGKTHYLEFAGNLTPVTKSGDQLTNKFLAFRENRLPFTVRVKDPNNDPLGRISFFREARTGKGEVQPNPICNLNISLPGDISPDHSYTDKDIMAIQEKYSFLRDSGYGKLNTIQKADLRISDISNHLGKDWVKVGRELDIEDQDINLIITEYPDNLGQQAMVMLRLWLNTAGHKATGNALKSALASCGRQDIIDECTISLSEVTDQDEMNIAEHELLQDGFDTFKAGLNGFGGKNSTLKRDYSMDVSYDENEIHQDRKHMSEISEERTESSDETEIKYRAEEKVFTESSFSQQSSTSQDSSLQKSSLIQESFDEIKMTHEESFSETRKESKMEIIESMVEGKMEKMSLDEVTSKQTVKSSTEQNVQEMTIQESSVQQSLVLESMESSVKHQSSVQESMMQQSTKQSIIQESSVQESMIQESSAQESMIHESSAQESMIQESSVQESIIQESSFQESMIQESSIQESVVQESMVQESSVQESFVQETKIQKSSIQEEQTEESIASNAQKQESRIETSTRVHESEVKEPVTENSAVKEVVQESKKEEMIEEIKFNEETKNGVTTSSEEKNLTIETTDSTQGANIAFTGTKTSLDEAGVTVVNEADKEDKEDKGDKGENEKEKKGIKGLKETLEESFEIIEPSSRSGVELKHEPSSEYSEESEPESPKSTSPKASSGSKSSSQQSGASRSSSAASSHGSSKEDLSNLKETEQELLDEIIVKDVPDVSTDPVLQFEDNRTSIESIQEDAEDQHSECKDLINDMVTSYTNPTLNFLSPNSFSNPNEMPSKEEHSSSTGLAAPDSKDSLEVHLYSVSDDISETASVKDETEKARNYSTPSEDESAVSIEQSALINVNEADQDIVFEEKKIVEARKETEDEDERSSGEEHFEFIQNEELKDEIQNIGEITDVGSSKYDEIHNVEEVEEEVYSEVKAKQIVESVQKEALTEAEIKSRKISEVIEAFEKIETDEKSDKSIEHGLKSAISKLEEHITQEDECVAVSAYKTTRSMSSSSEEASKLFAQESTDSNSASGLEGQNFTDLSMLEKGNNYEHSSLKQTMKKLEAHISSEDECIAVTAYRTTSSMSSTSEEAGIAPAHDSIDLIRSDAELGIVTQDSTDTSESSKQEITEDTVKIQEEVEQIGSIENDTSEAFKHSSTDSSDTEEKDEVHKGAESSSDYDTSSAKPRAKRPDSFVSDTSSDYDSMSNPGSRRPQSFLVEDDFDIITEEDICHLKSKQDDLKELSEDEDSLDKNHPDKSFDNVHDSSSESEGPDEKKQEKIIKEETLLSMDQDGISSIPRPTSSSPLPSSMTNTLDLHANQSTVSVDLAVSSVIHSNTLEEIDPLVVDGSRAPSNSSPLADGFLPSLTPSPLTRSSDFNTEEINSSQDLRNEEDKTTSSFSKSVKLSFPSQTDSPIKSTHIESSQPTQSSSFDLKSNTIQSSRFTSQSQDLQAVLEGISKSTVSTRLSELHKEEQSVFISVTEPATEDFVMVRRESSKSTDSEPSFRCRHLGSSSSEKSMEEKMRHDTSFRSSYEGSEIASPNNTDQFDAYTTQTMEEDDPMNTNEYKPIPKHKQLQKINSTDLLHRNIKETIVQQVMCEDDDSVMSESTITTLKSDNDDFTAIIESRNMELEFSVDKPIQKLSDIGSHKEEHAFKTAEEIFVEEPDWELVETQKENERILGEEETVFKRSMTPEQALEIASEIVQNVQVEAVKRYEAMKKSNSLPKPTPDSKYTPETKEKVQVYLKELEESEQYDHVAAELITHVVSKKEEQYMKMNNQISVDITDEEPRSDAMMSELRNELGRSSVTDEDLVTDLTTELLEENTIEEMKKHLESTLHSHEFQLESSFKFQTSFRTHFVDDVYGTSDENDGKTYTEKEFLCTENDDIYNFEEHKNLSSSQQADSFISEDIWEQESKSVTKQDFIKLREKKSNTESDSSGSKQSFRKSGTDHEGYSSSGETYSADRNNSSLSRPCSSDVEAIMSAVSEKSSTTGNTEYVTAQDHSSADTSFFTAASTLSSRGSVISSESSGHLGSREVSECSETLIESSLDLDSHHDGADTPNTFNQLQYALEESSFCPLESEDSTPSTEKSHGSAMQVGKSQENKILTSDDIDGCCFSQSLQDEENEKEYLIQDGKNRFGSMFSESRETLSSSVLTLSSVSEITVVGNEASYNKMISSQYSHSSVEKQSDSLSVSQLIMTESSSSSSSAAIYTTSKAESSEVPSSFEDLAKDNSTEQDQVFFMPRVRSFEGVHSVQISIPQEQSLDLGSEFDSRPNSELKDVESRPLSAQKLSRSNSQEDQKTGFSRRAFSIDETVSDGLKVFEPYCRPKSPMPLNESNRSSLDSESMQLRVCVSSSVRCPSPFNQKYQSEESIETELAFSKHFTQVLDDSEYETSEIIKTNQNENVHLTTGQLMDLTPESCNTSESLETSQGNDYYLEHDGKEFKARSPKLPFDLEDDLLVGSPPMVSRPLGVKYWPPVDNLDQELDACGPLEKRRIVRSESDDNSESRLELDNEMIEKEVEQGKRWLENQFEETPDEFGNFSYGQPLDQILEEEEDRYSYTTEDMKELQKFKESLTSTPDFDSIINKRHQVSKSGDDDLSMGSLTEFERLEREVALGSGSGSRGSLGSNDSLEVYSNGSGTGTGAGKPTHLSVKTVSKSGLGDNISVSSLNSLKSFEMIESACAEAALIEAKAKHQEEVLSEIEEGHESQVSESESCETISECGQKSDDEYEDRLFEIDSIIKQAQANVEKFETDKKQVGEILLADIIGKPESRTASISSTDSLDESVPEIQKEAPFRRQSSIPTRITSAYGSRTTSVTSLQSVTSASTLTQYDPDSVQDRDFDDEELDIMGKSMHISIDSLRAKSPENTMITSTDSLDPNTPRDKMTFSTDSIENAKSSDHMTVSLDSLDGAGKEDRSKDYTFETQGATSMLFTSTDSIESCSTNTRATASMLSSMTSQGSETLVADDEFEHDDEDSRSARRFLLNQGNLLFEDSDDSTTCSHSSPQLPARLFNKDSSECRLEKISTKPEHANVVSSEEVVETEEIDEKGNLIIKKVIQKRFYSEQTRRTENKREGYVSDVSSEKKDDSCEETMEEIDEFGNRKVYVVKRSIEFNKSKTMDAVDERELFDLSSAEPLSKNPKSKN